MTSPLFDGPVWMLGCGNMGGAVLRRWIAAGLDPAQVTIIKRTAGDVPQGVAWHPSAPDGAVPAMLVLGVKPQALDAALPLVAPAIAPETLVVSLLAGAGIEALRARLPAVRNVVRVMPNTPVGLGRGVVLLNTDSDDPRLRQGIERLMAPLGLFEWFDTVSDFDRATVLASCGPAFLFRFIDALAAGAANLGLPQAQAARLALATVEGAALLASQAGESPAVLADRVASPGGMTREGLNVLDADGALDRLIEDTLAAALRRGQDMAAAARSHG